MKLKSNLNIESTSLYYGTIPFDYNMLVITVSQCIHYNAFRRNSLCTIFLIALRI